MKRLAAVLLTLCMTCGIMACGSKEEKASLLSVDGKEYDLTGDFRDVVGAMVEDDIKVTSLTGQWLLYDEKGKYVAGSSGLKEGYDIAAQEQNQTNRFDPETAKEVAEEYGYFIRKDFYLNDMEDKDVVSGLGIASLEDVEKKLDQEKFLETGNSTHAVGDEVYMAVFVNGEALDFSAYEDELEEVKEYSDDRKSLLREFFPHISAIGMSRLCGDVFLGCRSYEELEGTADKLSVPLEETLLLTFALEDAYEKLEDEEIESFFVLSFGIDEEDETVNMGYSEFYFDKNWSEEKFR